jgi:polysaccharide export outer membrane protein
MRFAIPDSTEPVSTLMRRARGTLLLVALSLAGRAAQAQNPPLPSTPPVDSVARDVGTVRPGDLLTLVVYKQPDLSGTFLIDVRGFVNIPGIGSIRVAGYTPTQLHQTFSEAMSGRLSNLDFAVAVQIRVFINGEVREPKLYPVEPGTTLLQILTLAGGATESADLRHTRVIRDNRTFIVDLESGLTGSGAGRVILFSNDYVYIDRKRGFTRETLGFVLGSVTALLSFANLVIQLRK